MTVYVDDMNSSYGRMKMCHMIADTDEELHAMADTIGVARKWHQAPPRHDSHYDIASSKKALAIVAGAVSITWRQCGAMNRRRKITGELGKPADTWYADYLEQRRQVLAARSEEVNALFDNPIGAA
jgi:hypothetical protein